MPKRYNVAAAARIASYVMLSVLVQRHFREFFHWSASLTIALAAIGAGYRCSRLRLRLMPLLAISFASLSLLYVLAYSLACLVQSTGTHRAFLHLSVSWPVFVSLFAVPFGSTVLYRRSAAWIKAEPLSLLLVFCGLFWTEGYHRLTLFSHPVQLAAISFVFALLQFVCLYSASRRARASYANLAIFVPFLLTAGIIALLSFNSLSVASQGGLIQPTFFRFDFSQYLSLQNEIRMNDNLVLIARVPEEYSNSFIRRTWLAGWDPSRGFFEKDPSGAIPQRLSIPRAPEDIEHVGFALRHVVEQEYFIVNFDPKALLSMEYPTRVTPYKIWDNASFNGAYAVTSEVSGFMPFELYDCAPPSGDVTEGLSGRELSFYTEIDEETRRLVEPIARSAAGNVEGYLDRINALVAFLHDGDYRYSLKPGTAQDGNQLRHFLIESKRGYCTYFAFSLCLMLRSLGIPARVAAGFFMQPGSGALDYYPVRANMAHSWVEVFFPNYGWMAFDPTTLNVAEGETINFGQSAGGEEFLALLGEIFDKRALLEVTVEDAAASRSQTLISSLTRAILRAARSYGLPVLVIVLLLLGLFFRFRARAIAFFSSSPRRRIVSLAKDLRARSGCGSVDRDPVARKALTEALDDARATELHDLEQQARFAPECGDGEALRARALYSSLVKDPSFRKSARHIGRTLRSFVLAFAFLAAFCLPSRAQDGDTGPASGKEAHLSRALSAIEAENWEQALALLSEGERLYPDDPRYPYHRGVVFLDKGLYLPARGALTRALSLGIGGAEIYSLLSSCAGYLNDEEASLAYQRSYLELVPDDLSAWSTFGWLCYKTNRLTEGISAMLAATDRYGPDGTLFVSLGNLYTSAFDYENAKKYYTLAVDFARDRGQAYLLSIYYYNRSILEEVFYRFQDAEEDTKRSLEASARSSGYLMRGELALRRRDFREALEWYKTAYAQDTSPLAALGLTETLLAAGFPREAQAYLSEAKNREDLSWIANYGTTQDQFKSDIHRLQRDIHHFEYISKKRQFVHSFSTHLSKQISLIRLSCKKWYHNGLFRIYTKRTARYYELSDGHGQALNGNGLYQNSYYFLALDQWKRMALRYVNKARAIEELHVPRARPSYLYEIARLTGDSEALREAIQTLDPVWERDYLVKALSEALSGSKNDALAQTLYELQPSAFIAGDIALPVQFSYASSADRDAWSQRSRKSTMIRSFRRAGFKESRDTPFEIEIIDNPQALTLVLKNRNKNVTYCTQVIHNFRAFNKAFEEGLSLFVSGAFSSEIGVR